MLSTSFEYRKLISQNSKVLLKATLTLANGDVVNLSGDDFMMGSAAFSDAVSSDGSFDVGAAIIGQFSVSLNNYDQRFSDYDFTDATIVPYVGVELSGGSVEWLLKGHYTVEQPRSYGNTIGLTALDNMHLLEEPYSDVNTAYPATLQKIVDDICTACGITLASTAFANGSYVVDSRPDDDALSCIEMVAYAAQASGNYAKCDTGGRLVVDWYDTAAFESEDWLDGDRFDDSTPYDSGDDAYGGNFDDYSSGDEADGGDFDTIRFAIIHAISSSTIATDDVVITGVRVTAQNEVSQDGTQGQDGETSLYGSEGYVLDISGNPLILYGKASAVATQIGARVAGMRFRPFDLSAIGDPAIEAGDPAIITDRLQNQYRTFITSLTYKAGNYEAFSCGAETPSRNSATSFSALTQAIVKARNAVKSEKTAREAAIAELARELSESAGLFMTEVEQQDHSIIYYMHDKPTLAESQIVWKLTANALGISTDGGTTYPYGLDVSGTAILNRIYAIGIDASYINSGSLEVTDGAITVLSANAGTGVVVLQDSSGNYWNMHTGELRMAAASSIGNKTAQQVVDAVNASITDVDVEYAQNQSSNTAPTSGWSTNAPTRQAGYYIWQRTKTVSSNGTSYSDPVCISGRDGATGTNAATVYLYQRAATAPSKPSSSMTYTFSTGTLSGTLGNWSRGIPDGTDTCWVIVASAISNSDTDTISASEWSDPVALSTGGIDGLNQATIYLHQRAKAWKQSGKALVAPSSSMSVSGSVATLSGSASGTVFEFESEAPAKPSSALTYTFASGVLSGNLGNWSRGVPDGSDPVWVTLATAISAEATDTIAATEWSDPVKLAEDGEGSSVVGVLYAIGVSGTEPPLSGWQSDVPDVGKGFWLWAKTEFNDGSESLTCSYIGTDGEDGNSVAIQSVTKEMGITTVVLTNTDGTTETLTIADGEDGPNGTPGASGYVHVAWATSADGSQGFSTTVSVNKTYIGVYTDHTAADSEDYRDYSWSKIKGETGTGVSAVVEQYYLSNSDSAQTGGSWGTSQPAWQDGKYIWTRSAVTWTDGTTTYTSPVLAKAINSANENAQEAKQAVSDLDESLNQQAIFNRLTNNGQTQGIYLENGKVYINASYIKTGTLDANLITAGALVVRKNNVAVFSANLETGDVSISGECITIGSDSVTSVVNGIKASYGTCTTGADTQVKETTISNFTKYTGQTVTVKFSYANTASNPKLKVKNSDGSVIAEGYMLMNNSYFTSAQYWPAQGVLTFVWDGTYWRVADGATLSQIKVLQDSITLSVTDASLGNTATIKLEVNGRTAQTRTLDLTGVRNAFKNDTTAITISAGTVTFNSGTFVVNSTYFSVTSTGVITATSGTIGGFTINSTSIYNSKMTLDSDGLSLKNGTYNVGDIGTGQDVDDNTKKSLNFHLNGQGAMMTWAARTGTSGTYTRKLTYANKTFGGYTAGKLYVQCQTEFSYRTDFYANQYFHNYTAYNFWIDPNTGGADGGITGTMNFVQVKSMNSNGTVNQWYTGCKMRFKNGLLVEGTFNA